MLPTTAILMLAVFSLRTGEAIKCYDCNSKNDSKCASEDPSALASFGTDCSTKPDGDKYTLCRKIVQLTELELNGMQPHIRIIRSCGWQNASTPCYYRNYFGGEQTVCACSDRDFCNSAPSTYVTVLLVIAMLIFSFSIY